MKTIIVVLGLSLFSVSNAQSFQQDMSKALNSDVTELESNSGRVEKFENIAKRYPNEWLPKYYALLHKTVQAFDLPMDEAIVRARTLEVKLKSLKDIEVNSEILVLEALIKTIYLAKSPNEYGQSMYPKVLSLYDKALSLDANNPRAIYEKAHFDIKASKYVGESTVEPCKEIQKAIDLFEKQATNTINPSWGQNQAISVFADNCKK